LKTGRIGGEVSQETQPLERRRMRKGKRGKSHKHARDREQSTKRTYNETVPGHEGTRKNRDGGSHKRELWLFQQDGIRLDKGLPGKDVKPALRDMGSIKDGKVSSERTTLLSGRGNRVKNERRWRSMLTSRCLFQINAPPSPN